MNQEHATLLKEITEDILEKMGFEGNVIVTIPVNKDERNITVEITSPDSKFIIGKHGATLGALQHILKLIAQKKANDYVNFSIDVNGYKQEQEEHIKEVARQAADKALLDHRAVVLEPMNGYERRIIHLELENKENIKTESIGEKEERRVVVSPLSE